MEEKIEVKTILLGSTAVGKTSFFLAINGQDITQHGSTTGPALSNYESEYSRISYQIYDTAGQERFESMTKTYINDTRIAIFFTTCDKEHCESEDKALLKYYDDVVEIVGKKNFLPIFILNKIDLADDGEQINQRKREVEAKVKDHDPDLDDSFHLYAISCLTGKNLENTIRSIDNKSADFISQLKKSEPRKLELETESFFDRMKKNC